MPISTKPRRHRGGFAAARPLVVAAGFLPAGCSDDGFGTRHPVSGTVKFKGEPVKLGMINFIPDSKDNRAALGNIVDGAYTMTTFTTGDGVQPGTYKVTILSTEVDISKAQEKANSSGSGIDEFAVAKAVKKSKALLPKRYASADTSDLTREVKPEPNVFDFELTD